MKQLKISFTIYNQENIAIKSSVFTTTFFEEFPEKILTSALNLIKYESQHRDGYYMITDICVSEDTI